VAGFVCVPQSNTLAAERASAFVLLGDQSLSQFRLFP
jgi:hypothetical protein